jgi:hypothetical protein
MGKNIIKQIIESNKLCELVNVDHIYYQCELFVLDALTLVIIDRDLSKVDDVKTVFKK